MKNNEKRTFTTKEVLALLVSTFILSFALAMAILSRGKKQETVKYVEDKDLSLFLEQYNYIKDNYYEKVASEKLIHGAIAGMLNELDDSYSDYYDETTADTFNARLNGYYEGIGIEMVKFIDGPIFILNIFENSNAYDAGIRAGDLIMEIDDVDVSTISNEQFLTYVKNHDKEFNFKLSRNDEEYTVTVTKSYIKLKSVEYKMIDNYGYIKINIFALNTYEQFKETYEQLNNQSVKGIIIDVRDNSGGHLNIAENILSLFLSSNKVIYQTENQNGKTIVKSKGQKDYNLPIVILANENSASASELITSALSEQLGATIIGKKTYGKGMIQQLVQLSDGTEYKVTTDKWLTSEGVYIEGNGIAPDIEIEDTNSSNGNDKCLEKALEVLQQTT